MRKRNTSILVANGLLICSTAQIVNHYFKMPDFVTGSLFGIGIGMIILALIRSGKTA